jgi:riboflavin kinase/FMN adenylyltransferase
MMNIGKNPTVNGQKQTIEVHFFDIDQDLYGQEVQISLLSYLRDEKKFPTVEILKNQLQQDKQNSLQFIASQNVR